MTSMFSGATNFNQEIGGWNTSNVTLMNNMFSGATSFNNGGTSSINNWNTSLVTNMSGMFSSTPTSSFNQPIGGWTVSNVTNMSLMFSGSGVVFDQDIGDWDISSVANFTSFMSNKSPLTFTASNLDSIYNKWSLLTVQPNLNITFGTAKYNASAQTGKDILVGAPNNWTITDGGVYV